MPDMLTGNHFCSRPVWFVLNHLGGNFNKSAQKALERFNQSHEKNLELFAPTYVVREERDGAVRFRDASLTFHYVFVRGVFADVKELCAQPTNKFSFVIDRGSSDRYATIDDRRMLQFRNIAKVYKNCMPCYPIEEVDFEDGDLVEVLNGKFPGLIGRYVPKAKGKSGNIVLKVYDKLMTIAYDIKSTDVRVLEFSKNSTRPNDQIDAIVPHLLRALRLFDRGEEFPASLVGRISVFCGRMEVVKLDNRKMEAKLQALLYSACCLIGNTVAAERYLARFEKYKDSVTNEWTRGLIVLLFCVVDGDDRTMLVEEYNRLKTLDASSQLRRLIMSEYAHYLFPAEH